MDLKVIYDDKELEKLSRATHYAAGVDIRASSLHVIKPQQSVPVDCGIRLVIPEGFYMEVRLRSGHGFNSDLTAHPGIIDSDYRGPVKVLVRNHGPEPYYLQRGERFAQLIMQQVIPFNIIEIEEFEDGDSTARGEGGFGSTGL